MIQLKDKLKVNGGTRRYMEMIGLSLAFSLFAVSCTQDSDTFYPCLLYTSDAADE